METDTKEFHDIAPGIDNEFLTWLISFGYI